ncbi:MAG: hypothetical protein AAF416_23050 [Pseudomonadota bacterium]
MNVQRSIDPEIDIQVLEIGDASEAMLRGYRAGFEKTFMRAPQNLVWTEFEDLVQPERVLVVATEDGAIAAGLYYDRVTDEDGPVANLQGLYSNARRPGCARRSIRSALAYEMHACGHAVGALATIRIRADDSVNPAVSKVLASLGFHPSARLVVPLSPNARHRHLIPTANRSDENGAVFEVLQMRLSPKNVQRLVFGG